MKSNVLCLAVLFLLLFSGSCSKVDDAWINDELIGVWFDVRDYADQDQSSTVEWSFMEDGTMEIIYIQYKKSTGDFLGYSVLYKGDYLYKNDTLFMENMITYSYSFDGGIFIDGAAYFPTKESIFLNKETGVHSNSASVSFKKMNKELVLTYLECNDTGNCVGSETLTRK